MDDWYQTMTVSGVPGNRYMAASFREAEVRAIKDGYEVLDWSDNNTLVIAE